MSLSIARVIGRADPPRWAARGERIFLLADNGVIVLENGLEQLWCPFPGGKYPLDQIAISSRGIVCLTEKRLHVTLHFFDAESLQSLGSSETSLSVGISHMAFSAAGDELFVLSTVPETKLSVYRKGARDGNYPCVDSTLLQFCEGPHSLVTPAGECATVRCILFYTNRIVGYSRGDDGRQLRKCFTFDVATTSACSSGSDQLCFVTKEGEIHTFAYNSETHRKVGVLPSSTDAVCALVRDNSVFVLTSTGELSCFSLEEESQRCRSVGHKPSAFCRMMFTDTGKLLLTMQEGLLTMDPNFFLDKGTGKNFIKFWPRSRTLKCFAVGEGSSFVWILQDGSVARCEPGLVTVFSAEESNRTALYACTLDTSHLLILFENAKVVCLDHESGKEVWSHQCAEGALTSVEADGYGNVACCGQDTIRFLRCTGDAVVDHGSMRATLLAPICLVRWLPTEASLLALCENGDAFLVGAPSDGDAQTIHTAEILVRNSWRLDFPVIDVLICHATPEFLNIFVHSADNDSKVYALDRQHEGDAKVSRPLFLIHDHNSGGSCLVRFSDSKLLSCGRDGTVAARDLTPYQMQMTPIPPSREKRRPLWVQSVRSSFDGGITVACVVGGGVEVICGGGKDGILHCVSQKAEGERTTWQEPQWKFVQPKLACAADNASTDEEQADMAPEREDLRRELTRVREAWSKAMAEKDAEVPLESFLTPEQREKFAAECDSAIFEMREGHYYHSILNEYLQELIRKRCCDAMEVTRMKVVSMTTRDLEVHNFHIHRKTRFNASLSRKALFIRQLQKKMSVGRYAAPALQLGSETLADASKDGAGSHDYEKAMFRDADVYTQCRMALQSFLVKGRSLALKDDFNRQFADLQDLKRQSVTQVEERTLRCVTIGKQLGSFPAPLFTSVIDPEENPNSLFAVEEKELSPEAQALIPPAKGTMIVSAVDEAALHLWMDGLEKEVERLEVHVSLPEFADDSRDAFVPPDERTEEQQRAMDNYTKKLKEESERVEAKKEALRGEFKSLQKENRETAAKLDEHIRQLRQGRLNVVEVGDEAELQLTLLLLHRLCVSATHIRYRSIAEEKRGLGDKLSSAESTLAQQIRALAAAETILVDAQNEMSSYAANVKDMPPFDDDVAGEKLHRRFARWQRRFEEGKGSLPDPNVSAADFSLEQWAAFCEHCQAVSDLQQLVIAAERRMQQAEEEVAEAGRQCEQITHQMDATSQAMDAVRSSSVSKLLDVHAICRLHQGQIQDESATTLTAFVSSNLRWRDDAAQYNHLILQSDEESRGILSKVYARRKLMKLLGWEEEGLLYQARTLQLELQQLHTLRVTRQMQEWLCGDADVSEEKALGSIQRHMDLVEANMRRKVEERRRVMRSLKSQMAERATENVIVGGQCDELDETVRANSAVYALIETHADGTQMRAARAKEIFQSSELEELARSQQEELVRLKKEVDRLRERTFPSFAVVSKHTR